MGAAEFLEQGINGEGVAPDQLRGEVLDDGDGLPSAVDAFAQARHAGVGFDLDPKVHPVAHCRGGLDSGDFHRLLMRVEC